ncbi:hypothetical protein [Ferrovibrio sp.]|uniref:hypothetical protein n=1 Tax=Ferrovibrio sp. TaxID=1917215 RepID=UPI000CBD7917|nr:hypothetical protein [Ferrovibrio sp.]PJI43217.1 MAG: hypothetical protein CTR53_02765 [Ferrovibrio sp.]
MTNGGTRHYAADEIVAPALIALKAWYDEARGSKSMAAFDTLPPPHELPGPADLALIEVAGDGRYAYLAMGEQYRRTAALKPDADGVTRETRPVVRQHLDLAFEQRDAFHVSITRWDGPKILQYDRLILPLTDAEGSVSHLLVGEVFLRVAKPG